MKLAFLLLVMVSLPAAAEPAPLQVTANVVEMPKQIRLCGKIAFRSVVRYEVVSVDKGKLTGKQLLVVETCPEFLEPGETRKLRLWPTTKNDSYSDEFKSMPGPRWVHRDLES
jgi:hypothetical protein